MTIPDCTIDQLREITDLQAQDGALWIDPQSVETAYVQQALRYLTRAIEGDWTFEQARDAVREMMA